MSSITSIVPHPTRNTAVLRFDYGMPLFFNDERLEEVIDPVSRIQSFINKWEIDRELCGAISCTPGYVHGYTSIHQRHVVTFYSENEDRQVGEVFLYVPEGWYPRTTLCLIYNSVLPMTPVLSCIRSHLGVDINGILRDNAGEAVVDTHDVLKGSRSDREVNGGGVF